MCLLIKLVLVWCTNLAYVRVCVCGARFNMIMPAENIAAALAFSSLVRSLEEKVESLTADNERLERELTNTQVDLRATKTELTQHQEESQQALESLTKKCLAFEGELSKFCLGLKLFVLSVCAYLYAC